MVMWAYWSLEVLAGGSERDFYEFTFYLRIPDCIADLVFLIDDSGSIRDSNVPGEPDNWNVTLKFIRDFVGSLQVGDNNNRIAAVTYSNKAYVQFYLNQYDNKRDIQAAIDRIPYTGGNTNTTGGFRVVRTDVLRTDRGDRPSVKNVVVLVTDGKTTREVESLYDEACRLKGPGALIFGIGVTNQINVTELQGVISSPWYDFYHIASDFGVLESKLKQIVLGFCFMASSSSSGGGYTSQGAYSSGRWAAVPNPEGPNPYRCIPTQFSDSIPLQNNR